MKTEYKISDPGYRQRVTDSFNKQGIMQTMNASLDVVNPGHVEISFLHQDSMTQQHAFIHGGIVATVLDSACGYSAYSLMSADAGILTIEFKVNLLAPAKGERFVAIGKVKKPGRTITVTEGEMFAYQGDNKKLIATLVGTMMTMTDSKGLIKG